MFYIYATKYTNLESNIIRLHFEGETLKEAMNKCRDAMEHNNLSVYTSIYIYDVVNSEEIGA